jgi:hypothetical protein
MDHSNWEDQFRQFLRRTGEDFRRASEEVKAEAQRLLDAAMDPEKQQRVRDRLNELTTWARKTAEGVAGAVGEAAVKAEGVFFRMPEKDASSGAQQAPTSSGEPAAQPATRAPSAKRKTSGGKARKPSGGKARKQAASKSRTSKPKSGKSRAKKGGKRKR